MIIMIDIVFLLFFHKQRFCLRALFNVFRRHASVTPDPETVITRTRHGGATHVKVKVVTDDTARTQEPHIFKMMV